MFPRTAHARPTGWSELDRATKPSSANETKGQYIHINNAARAVTAVMSTGLRRAVILPVAAVALGAASLITPAVTSASLPAACGGDVCFSLASIYGTFFAWAPNYAFFGHFELQTPEHTVLNSTHNKQWAAGQEYQFHVGDHMSVAMQNSPRVAR